ARITVRTSRLRGLPPAPRGWGPGPVSGGVAAVIGILGDVPWNGPADHAGGTNPPAPFAGGVCSGEPRSGASRARAGLTARRACFPLRPAASAPPPSA